jgi:MFS family permease
MVTAQVWNSGMARAETASVIETDVPARLDRLPWGRFHSLVVAALGITWILDGLEVTLAGSVAGVLKQGASLGLSNSEIGQAGSAYVAGAVLGALLFGWLTDRLGRRRLFFITLAVYMTAAVATGLSWNLASFLLFRFLTGAGIGGEYAAINSTIQELVPCRYRGWTDLAINGSFWVGAALGAAGSVVLLDPHVFAVDVGWRLCFMIGAALSIVIFVMRLWLPETPRWLVTHGRAAEAAAIVTGIERRFEAAGQKLPAIPLARARFRGRNVGLREVLHSLFWVHRQRALVGLSLMAAQAFFYNAIFFTYALVLTDFYGVPADRIGWYILPFAAGNFLGPLLLGHFFDSIGRKPMIAGTYILSGLLLAVSGYLFQQGQLSATGQTVAWMIVFFFASAAASSAYLTVSETFPLEVRAMAIAVFYAVGTGLGGIAGPLLFGRLIETGSRQEVFIGYLIGAALMLGAAVVLLIWGVAAERKPLETVCRPLTLAE